MTSAHIKTTLAALALAGTAPAHLRRIQQDHPPTPAPAAGGASQGAAPRAADPGFSWDEVVTEQNAKAGLGQPQAAVSAASTADPTPAAVSYLIGTVDWEATVASVNAENGCSHPGANPDPALAAMLSGRISL